MTTETPLLVFNSFGLWAEAGMQHSARIAAAMRHGDRPGAELDKWLSIIGDQTFGRGGWIRTNGLQYPKRKLTVSHRVTSIPIVYKLL
jgi:hypothetical protein